MVKSRKKVDPLSVEELIATAYEGESEQRRREGSDFPEACPPNVKALLKVVDSMVRQRLLEHSERERSRARRRE